MGGVRVHSCSNLIDDVKQLSAGCGKRIRREGFYIITCSSFVLSEISLTDFYSIFSYL